MIDGCKCTKENMCPACYDKLYPVGYRCGRVGATKFYSYERDKKRADEFYRKVTEGRFKEVPLCICLRE